MRKEETLESGMTAKRKTCEVLVSLDRKLPHSLPAEISILRLTLTNEALKANLDVLQEVEPALESSKRAQQQSLQMNPRKVLTPYHLFILLNTSQHLLSKIAVFKSIHT